MRPGQVSRDNNTQIMMSRGLINRRIFNSKGRTSARPKTEKQGTTFGFIKIQLP